MTLLRNQVLPVSPFIMHRVALLNKTISLKNNHGGSHGFLRNNGFLRPEKSVIVVRFDTRQLNGCAAHSSHMEADRQTRDLTGQLQHSRKGELAQLMCWSKILPDYKNYPLGTVVIRHFRCPLRRLFTDFSEPSIENQILKKQPQPSLWFYKATLRTLNQKHYMNYHIGNRRRDRV